MAKPRAVESGFDDDDADVGADGYVLDDQIGYLLRRAHQRATAIFQSEMGGELTPTQWAALVRLYTHGAVSQNELGRLMAVDPATVQGVIHRLDARALIERRPDPDDRRRAMVSLSTTGRALVSARLPVAHEVSAATLAPLEPEERAHLLALLRRLA